LQFASLEPPNYAPCALIERLPGSTAARNQR
jgi:hypothetical protein